MPDLDAAIPSRLFREVGAAAAKQEVAGGAYEGAAEAGGIGSFRKSGPAHEIAPKEDRPHWGVQRLGGRRANVVAHPCQSVLFRRLRSLFRDKFLDGQAEDLFDRDALSLP